MALLLLAPLRAAGAQAGLADSAARLLARGDSALRSPVAPDRPRARSLYHEAAVLYRRAGQRSGEAEALGRLGAWFAAPQGSSDSALHYLHRSLALRRGNPAGSAAVMALVGEALIFPTQQPALQDSGVKFLAQAAALYREQRGDSLAAGTLLALAKARIFLAPDRFYLDARWPEATLGYLRSADSLGLRAADLAQRAEAARLIGIVFSQGLQRPDSSLGYFQHALSLTRQGRPAGSLERASAITLLAHIGNTYRQLGSFDSARVAYHRQLAAVRESPSAMPSSGLLTRAADRHNALLNLAGLFTEYRITDSAVYYARELVQNSRGSLVARFMLGPNLAVLAQALRRAGQPDSAIRYAQEALARLPTDARISQSGRVRANPTLGLSYVTLGLPDSALAYFRAQLELLRGPPALAVDPELLTNLGATHRLLAARDSALWYFQRSLAAARQSRKRRAEANALAHLAFTYQGANNSLAALAYLDSAAAVRREAGLPFLDWSAAPPLEESLPEPAGGERIDAKTRTPIVRLLPLIRPSSDSADVIVAVAASDRGGGVQDVRLYDNGAPVGTSLRGVAVSRQSCPTGATCFRVTLPPGRHTLEATATARDGGEGERASLSVTIPGPKRPSTIHILGIGIDEYDNPAYKLGYAKADVRAVLDSLRRGSEGAFQRPAVIETLLDRQATRDSIEARLFRLAQRMQPEDVFVFYYAGHGKETTIGAGTSFYLVPSDVRDMNSGESLGSRGISSARLLELLRNLPARQKLVIIDACQSGGVASAYAWQDPARNAFNQLAVGAGTWILAASRPQQNAAESPALGHGVFTYALLQALGSGQERREISVASLFSEVSARLPALSLRARTPSQMPVALAVGEIFTIGVR